MQGAIFDMDGLIIDSEPLWRLAEKEIFSTVGLDLTDADCRRTTGLRADEVVEFWFERRPWTGVDRKVVLKALESRVADLIRSRGRKLTGVDQTIDQLREAGLHLALASSSTPELIDVVLSSLGMGDVFEVVCSAAQEERGKPDPAVYFTATRRLGLPPGQCVAFEDSLAGVQAAHAAGLMVVAVPAPEQFHDPGFAVADLVLASLEDLDLETLPIRPECNDPR